MNSATGRIENAYDEMAQATGVPREDVKKIIHAIQYSALGYNVSTYQLAMLEQTKRIADALESLNNVACDLHTKLLRKEL